MLNVAVRTTERLYPSCASFILQTPMKKLLVMVGSTAESALGWWLGTPGGIFGSFIVSMVGLGLGMWAGARIAERFGA